MTDNRCRVDDACLGDGSGSGLGRIGRLCLCIRLGLAAVLALQSRHVVVILVVVLFLLVLTTQSGTAAKLGEVDAAEVAACACEEGWSAFFLLDTTWHSRCATGGVAT